jgi:hypothetical protein
MTMGVDLLFGILVAFLVILFVLYIWISPPSPPPPSKIVRGDNTFPLIGPLIRRN